jgi:hypothetical protein
VLQGLVGFVLSHMLPYGDSRRSVFVKRTAGFLTRIRKTGVCYLQTRGQRQGFVICKQEVSRRGLLFVNKSYLAGVCHVQTRGQPQRFVICKQVFRGRGLLFANKRSEAPERYLGPHYWLPLGQVARTGYGSTFGPPKSPCLRDLTDMARPCSVVNKYCIVMCEL